MAWHVTIAPSWFDPSTAPPQITPFGMLYAIHDALVRPYPGQKMGPSLAESWQREPGRARRTSSSSRRGLTFHNGDPVTAEDVKFSFERYKGAGAKELQDRVQQVEIVDPLTVRFLLKEPWPDFMTFYGTTATAAGIVVPKKYFTQVGEDGFRKHPIGAGPYKFVSHQPGIEVVLEAYPRVLAPRAQRQDARHEERARRQHARGDAEERRGRHRGRAGRPRRGGHQARPAVSDRGQQARLDLLDRVRRPVGSEVAVARQAHASGRQLRARPQEDQRGGVPRLLPAGRRDRAPRHGLRAPGGAAAVRSPEGEATARRGRVSERARCRRVLGRFPASRP